MWSTFKSMPLLPKIFIILLVVGFAWQITVGSGHRNSKGARFTPVSDERSGYPNRSNQADQDQSDQDQADRDQSDQDGQADLNSQRSQQQSQASAANQNLAQFQAQQVQLQSRVQQCEAQMTEATNRQAMAAMQGVMYNSRPACEQAMPQWIAQEAYLETEIQRIHDPNDHRSVQEIAHIAPYSPSYPRGGGSGGGSNDGTAAVENWDRQAIRGTSIYTDESGQQHELPTREYYYRDRSSGQTFGSDQSTPPNDGRDYEQFSSSQPQ